MFFSVEIPLGVLGGVLYIHSTSHLLACPLKNEGFGLAVVNNRLEPVVVE